MKQKRPRTAFVGVPPPPVPPLSLSACPGLRVRPHTAGPPSPSPSASARPASQLLQPRSSSTNTQATFNQSHNQSNGEHSQSTGMSSTSYSPPAHSNGRMSPPLTTRGNTPVAMLDMEPFINYVHSNTKYHEYIPPSARWNVLSSQYVGVDSVVHSRACVESSLSLRGASVRPSSSPAHSTPVASNMHTLQPKQTTLQSHQLDPNFSQFSSLSAPHTRRPERPSYSASVRPSPAARRRSRPATAAANMSQLWRNWLHAPRARITHELDKMLGVKSSGVASRQVERVIRHGTSSLAVERHEEKDESHALQGLKLLDENYCFNKFEQERKEWVQAHRTVGHAQPAESDESSSEDEEEKHNSNAARLTHTLNAPSPFDFTMLGLEVERLLCADGSLLESHLDVRGLPLMELVWKGVRQARGTGISSREFVTFLSQCSKQPQSALATLFAKMDCNSDEHLSWDEYLSYLLREMSHHYTVSTGVGTYGVESQAVLHGPGLATTMDGTQITKMLLFGEGPRKLAGMCRNGTVQIWDEKLHYLYHVNLHASVTRPDESDEQEDELLPLFSVDHRGAPGSLVSSMFQRLSHTASDREHDRMMNKHKSRLVNYKRRSVTAVSRTSSAQFNEQMMLDVLALEAEREIERVNAALRGSIVGDRLYTSVSRADKRAPDQPEKTRDQLESHRSRNKQPLSARPSTARASLSSARPSTGCSSHRSYERPSSSLDQFHPIASPLECVTRSRDTTRDKLDMHTQPYPFPLIDMAYYAHNKQLVVAAQDRSVRFYSMRRRAFELDALWYLHSAPQCLLASNIAARDYAGMDVDRQLLLVGNSNGSVCAYNPRNHQMLVSSHVHSRSTMRLELFPDIGLVSCGLDGRLAIIDMATFQTSRYLGQPLTYYPESDYHPDEYLRRSHSNPPLQSNHGHVCGIFSFALCPTYRAIVSAGYDRQLFLWDPHIPNKPTWKLHAGSSDILDVLVNEQKNQIISVCTDKKIRIFDLRSLKSIQETLDLTEYVPDSLSACMFDTQSQVLYTASNKISCFGVQASEKNKSNVILQGSAHAAPVVAVLYSNTFQSIVSVAESQSVRVWHALTGAIAFEFSTTHGSLVTGACLDPSQKRLITCAHNGTVHMYNFNNGELLHTFSKRSTEVSSVVLLASSSGSLLGIGWEKCLIRWPAPSEKDSDVTLHRGHRSNITCITSLSSFLITAAGDEIISWNPDSGHRNGACIFPSEQNNSKGTVITFLQLVYLHDIFTWSQEKPSSNNSRIVLIVGTEHGWLHIVSPQSMTVLSSAQLCADAIVAVAVLQFKRDVVEQKSPPVALDTALVSVPSTGVCSDINSDSSSAAQTHSHRSHHMSGVALPSSKTSSINLPPNFVAPAAAQRTNPFKRNSSINFSTKPFQEKLRQQDVKPDENTTLEQQSQVSTRFNDRRDSVLSLAASNDSVVSSPSASPSLQPVESVGNVLKPASSLTSLLDNSVPSQHATSLPAVEAPYEIITRIMVADCQTENEAKLFEITCTTNETVDSCSVNSISTASAASSKSSSISNSCSDRTTLPPCAVASFLDVSFRFNHIASLSLFPCEGRVLCLSSVSHPSVGLSLFLAANDSGMVTAWSPHAESRGQLGSNWTVISNTQAQTHETIRVDGAVNRLQIPSHSADIVDTSSSSSVSIVAAPSIIDPLNVVHQVESIVCDHPVRSHPSPPPSPSPFDSPRVFDAHTLPRPLSAYSDLPLSAMPRVKPKITTQGMEQENQSDEELNAEKSHINGKDHTDDQLDAEFLSQLQRLLADEIHDSYLLKLLNEMIEESERTVDASSSSDVHDVDSSISPLLASATGESHHHALQRLLQVQTQWKAHQRYIERMKQIKERGKHQYAASFSLALNRPKHVLDEAILNAKPYIDTHPLVVPSTLKQGGLQSSIFLNRKPDVDLSFFFQLPSTATTLSHSPEPKRQPNLNQLLNNLENTLKKKWDLKHRSPPPQPTKKERKAHASQVHHKASTPSSLSTHPRSSDVLLNSPIPISLQSGDDPSCSISCAPAVAHASPSRRPQLNSARQHRRNDSAADKTWSVANAALKAAHHFTHSSSSIHSSASLSTNSASSTCHPPTVDSSAHSSLKQASSRAQSARANSARSTSTSSHIHRAHHGAGGTSHQLHTQTSQSHS